MAELITDTFPDDIPDDALLGGFDMPSATEAFVATGVIVVAAAALALTALNVTRRLIR